MQQEKKCTEAFGEQRRRENDNDLKSVSAALLPFFITFFARLDDILSLRFASCTSSLIGVSLTLI